MTHAWETLSGDGLKSGELMLVTGVPTSAVKTPWYDDATMSELAEGDDELELLIAMATMRDRLPHIRANPRWTFDNIQEQIWS